MYIYIGLAIFYVLCMIIEKIIGAKINKQVWVFLLSVPLFVIAAFRAPTVGNDTALYMRSYDLVVQEGFFSNSQSRLEIGYIYYMRFIGLLGLSYFGFQIITTLITLFSTSRFILNYSKSIAFSYFILVTSRMFFGIMNISRQYLAVAILLFSIEFLRNRKIVKFTSIVLIATSIHFTSIIFLILYPISKLKFNLKKTSVFILLGVLSSVFFDYLITIFVNITGRYSGYLEGGYFNFEGNIAIYINLLINTLFFLLALFTKYWREYDVIGSSRKTLPLEHGCQDVGMTSIEKVLYASCLLTLIFSIAGLNATILSRIETYFSVFFLVFIPNVVLRIKTKELRSIIVLGIISGLFASFIVVMIFRPYWTTVFPYQWFWNWQ